MPDGNWKNRIAAASAARGHVRDAMSRGAQVAKDLGGTVRQSTSTVSELVAGIEGPPVPLGISWGVGLGQVLSGHPKLSDGLRRLVGHLDRFGQIGLSPSAINFDGEEVRWEKVDEIIFAAPSDVITSHALQMEVKRLKSLLPPVPGRAWLVGQVVGVMAALCLAVAGPTETSTDDDDEVSIGVPVSVMYGGLMRRKQLTPGVFAALIAASRPTVSEAITRIAQERGIKVTAAPPSRSHRQAVAMRGLAASITSRFTPSDDLLAIEDAETVGDDETIADADAL